MSKLSDLRCRSGLANPYVTTAKTIARCKPCTTRFSKPCSTGGVPEETIEKLLGEPAMMVTRKRHAWKLEELDGGSSRRWGRGLHPAPPAIPMPSGNAVEGSTGEARVRTSHRPRSR